MVGQIPSTRPPIAFSIATVFLFTGPHNWLEARYILGRLPARAGRLRGFFAVSVAGIVGLTAAFAYIPSYLGSASAALGADTLYVGWNTAFLLWVYGTTRYVYFVVALLHVLAEVPFLLRML